MQLLDSTPSAASAPKHPKEASAFGRELCRPRRLEHQLVQIPNLRDEPEKFIHQKL